MKPLVRRAPAALVLAAALLAGPAPRAAAGPPRALSLDGTLYFTAAGSRLVTPLLFETYTFTGELGDFGAVTGTANEVIDVLTASTGLVTVTSSFTVVTADGDKLFGSSVGTIDLTEGTISEVLTITGGTGAYWGATGTALGEGSLADGAETLDGTVLVP